MICYIQFTVMRHLCITNLLFLMSIQDPRSPRPKCPWGFPDGVWLCQGKGRSGGRQQNGGRWILDPSANLGRWDIWWEWNSCWIYIFLRGSLRPWELWWFPFWYFPAKVMWGSNLSKPSVCAPRCATPSSSASSPKWPDDHFQDKSGTFRSAKHQNGTYFHGMLLL